MNIFVTVGFENFPFDRLLKIIDRGVGRGIIKDELKIQIGTSSYIPQFCASQRFFPFEEIVERIRKADIVICHAGVGTTLLTLQSGKIPILFPRMAKYGEHIDDHQVDFARKMQDLKKVLVAYDEAELLYQIKNYESLVKGIHSYSCREPSTALRSYIQQYLEEID